MSETVFLASLAIPCLVAFAIGCVSLYAKNKRTQQHTTALQQSNSLLALGETMANLEMLNARQLYLFVRAVHLNHCPPNYTIS
jgi:hypothetical protein